MSDREALAFALAHIDQHITFGDAPGSPSLRVAVDAARERLAQLPEKCGMCGGEGSVDNFYTVCRDCHGSGKVYPQETVELIAQVLYTMDASWIDQQRNPWPLLVKAQRKVYEAKAVAVLDALGETE